MILATQFVIVHKKNFNLLAGIHVIAMIITSMVPLSSIHFIPEMAKCNLHAVFRIVPPHCFQVVGHRFLIYTFA